MKHTTTYHVRALGTLWNGAETWGEMTSAAPITENLHGPCVADGDGTACALFPDWVIVTDYEVVQTRSITQTWTRGATRYTSISETNTVFRAWSDRASADHWLDLDTTQTLQHDLTEAESS